jgi:hypothetical protein
VTKLLSGDLWETKATGRTRKSLLIELSGAPLGTNLRAFVLQVLRQNGIEGFLPVYCSSSTSAAGSTVGWRGSRRKVNPAWML